MGGGRERERERAVLCSGAIGVARVRSAVLCWVQAAWYNGKKRGVECLVPKFQDWYSEVA